jgi:pilus assembly protein Flp/PilA
MALIARFLTDESGTTAIEYALIAAGISIVIIAAVQAIGGSVLGLFTTVKDALP